MQRPAKADAPNTDIAQQRPAPGAGNSATSTSATAAAERDAAPASVAHRSGPVGGPVSPWARQFHDSPRQVAQRQRLRPLFGSTARLPDSQEPTTPSITSVQRQVGPTSSSNQTGLPDGLKRGIESLSGMAMNHVRVHPNSAQPGQVGALAYAQGSDIHLAPGQEQHLAHEAWHVVQQAQGRVRSTKQLRSGVPINDQPELEREADEMGAKALQLRASEAVSLSGGAAMPLSWAPGQRDAGSRPASGFTLQGVFHATDFKSLLQEQERLQKRPDGAFGNGFTTVGFEHEFAQMIDGPLMGLTHVEIASSTDKLDFTGLGFSLETDADNALELVCPPFLVELISPERAVPDPDDVSRMDALIKQRLSTLVAAETTVKALVGEMGSDPGIRFALRDASVKKSNVNPGSRIPAGSRKAGDEATLPHQDIANSKLKFSRKSNHKIDISSQVNVATDASLTRVMKTLRSGDEPSSFDRLFRGIQLEIEEQFALRRQACVDGLQVTPNLDVFLAELARTLAGHLALRSLHEVEQMKGEMFVGGVPGQQASNRLSKGSANVIYKLHTGLRSHVKDVQGVWLKDTVTNFGLGFLTGPEWLAIQKLALSQSLWQSFGALGLPPTDFKQEERKELGINLQYAAASMVETLKRLAGNIMSGRWVEGRPESHHGPAKRLEFGSHDNRWLGLRQDTYIPAEKVRRPALWEGGRLHVVEGRGHALRTLYELKVAETLRTQPTLNDKTVAAMFLDKEGIDEGRVREIRRLLTEGR